MGMSDIREPQKQHVVHKSWVEDHYFSPFNTSDLIW